jgi:hypothetical protein
MVYQKVISIISLRHYQQMLFMSRIFFEAFPFPLSLPTFTLRQLGQSQREIIGIPRPEPKGVARKNHKALGFSWNGRALPLGDAIGLVPCRGALPGARWARLILRRPAEVPEKRFFPTDAFCARHLWVRASSSHLLRI